MSENGLTTIVRSTDRVHDAVRSKLPGNESRPNPEICLMDLAIVLLILLGGFAYHFNPVYWSCGYTGVGSASQYGDAMFWWNGVIHLARGIVENNPGTGFRPGYFLFSAPPVALFGWTFAEFHKFFLIVLMASCAWLFLTLRPILGRLASAIACAVIVFNPVTAEWSSTSTTDSLGMVLNLVALCCLLNAALRNFSLGYTGLFGAFFSLSTLTRPLVTPFVCLPMGLILLQSKLSLKRRLLSSFTMLMAFLLPTFAWMGIQKIVVGEWSISQNDASAFYGASDPKIQVWAPTIYENVEKSAKSRLHKSDISAAELNEEFWRLTAENYTKPKNFKYHFRRLFPHTWRIADFTSSLSNHSWLAPEQWGLLLFLSIILLRGIRNRKLLASSIAGGLLALQIHTGNHPGIWVLSGAVLSLYLGLRDRSFFPIVLVALYWITGVFALALVGGTWGNYKLWDSFAINALGYRLGLQVFFASILLEYFVLSRLLSWSAPGTLNLTQGCSLNILAPNRASHFACWSILSAITVAVLAVETAGSVIVLTKAREREHTPVVLFPDFNLATVRSSQEACQLPKLGQTVISRNDALLGSKIPDTKLSEKFWRDSADVYMVATGTEFVWNLQGQNRTQMAICQQKRVEPFDMSPSWLIVEIPGHARQSDWKYRQGIYVVRRLGDLPQRSHIPYYRQEPVVRGFIPLSKDHKKYSLADARWFQIQKYVSHLLASGECTVTRGTLAWDSSSGEHLYQRRINLKPQVGSSEVELTLSLSSARGARRLSFGIESAGLSAKAIQATVKDLKNEFRKVISRYAEVAMDIDTASQQVTVKLENVPAEGVFVYEFTLECDDFLYQ